MSDTIQGPSSYHDFAGLGRLRGQAHKDSDAATRETAQQFEAMFIQMMMKPMREAAFKSDLVESQSLETYQGLYDKELSMQMARRGALGVADMLTAQLARAKVVPLEADKLNLPQGNESAPLPGLPLKPERAALPLHRAKPTLAMPPVQKTEFALDPTQSPASGNNSYQAE